MFEFAHPRYFKNFSYFECPCFRQSLGATPLSQKDSQRREKKVDSLKETERRINKMIANFNLIVPVVNNQKFPLSLKQESENIFEESFEPYKKSDYKVGTNTERDETKQKGGILSNLFKSMFNKR